MAYLDLNYSLPVKMHSVNAVAGDCKSPLSWMVAREEHVAYYAIEPSGNAVNFNEVGMINASNNNETDKLYDFTDDKSPSGTSFYRIRQVDKDGSLTYSTVKEVTLNSRGKNNVLVYPTVTKGMVNVQLPPGFEGAKIRVLSADGQEVTSDKNTGFNRTLNLLKATNGTYTLQIFNYNKITENVKIIVIR